MTVESDEETDSLNVTVESNDGSLYVPTPQRKVRERIENTSIIPSSICFMDLKQLNKFIKQVNQYVVVPHLVVKVHCVPFM